MSSSPYSNTPPLDKNATLVMNDPAAQSFWQRYEILEEFDRGGMGIVFRARQRQLDRLVAVKICKPDVQFERFEREAKILARMYSPHIVAIHDFERLPDGQAAIVMAWIDGSDLAKLLEQASSPIHESRAVAWMRQVCEGMQAAADAGVVHRDLKPANILLDRQDAALVADFGLARSHDFGQFTQSGSIVGSPFYMSPEQAEDPRSADIRSDIYSFGATFYHVLTGKTPFDGSSYFSVMLKHKTEPLVSPKVRNAALTDRTAETIERCLAKSPVDRFQSFREIKAAMDSGVAEPSPWEIADDPEVSRYLARYREDRDNLLGPNASWANPRRYTFPQQRTLEILVGDLAAQQVDVIVNSVSGLMEVGSGLFAQLCRVAGSTLEEEAWRLRPVRPGRAVVTSAGNLKARFVFHGVTMGLRDSESAEWINPSRDIINEIMESCFYHADTLGIRSIAFPLLGTGVGRFPKDVCLDTMVRFLARKFVRGATTVRDAKIVIYAQGIEQPD